MPTCIELAVVLNPTLSLTCKSCTYEYAALEICISVPAIALHTIYLSEWIALLRHAVCRNKTSLRI